MKYIEINVTTSKAGLEIVIGKLYALGITDIAIDDPTDVKNLLDEKETYHWDYVEDSVLENMDRDPKVTICLEDNEDNRRLSDIINSKLIDMLKETELREAGLDVLKTSVEYKDDSKWKDKWKEFFKPKKISERFVVKPTWEEYEKHDDELVIEIDPGMAFGTGTHETTSLCIRGLEQYLKAGDLLLDVGCGSGILSIAGYMLGASEILGIDIDNTAVEVSIENAELNKLDDRAKFIVGDLTKGVDFKADVIVANLMADLVIMLSGSAREHLKQGGIFISSGILNEKEATVSNALIQNGFEILDVVKDGQWCMIVAK